MHHVHLLLHLAARPRTPRPALLLLFELFQVFIEAVGEQDLATAPLAPLHLHDHLSAGHLGLLLLHPLPTLLVFLHLLLVADLLGLPLLPLLVGDARHDLHRLLRLLVLLLLLPLVQVFQPLLVEFLLLLDHALLQPLLELAVAILHLGDLGKALFLLLAKLLLLLEGLGDQLALLPLVHAVDAILVLAVQGGLLDDQLLKEVLLGLEDQHLAQALLVLLDAQPLRVRHLRLRRRRFLLSVLREQVPVLPAHVRRFVSLVLLEVHLLSILRLVSIHLFLGDLVEAFEEFLVLEVLSTLLVEANLVLLKVVLLVVAVARLLLPLLVDELLEVAVALVEFALLLEVDDFGVVHADGPAHGLAPHHLVDQVHRFRGQLHLPDRLPLFHRRVEESDRVRVLVSERSRWHVLDLGRLGCFGVHLAAHAHWHHAVIVEPSSRNHLLRLLLLQVFHYVVLLDAAEVVLVCHTLLGVDATLGLPEGRVLVDALDFCLHASALRQKL